MELIQRYLKAAPGSYIYILKIFLCLKICEYMGVINQSMWMWVESHLNFNHLPLRLNWGYVSWRISSIKNDTLQSISKLLLSSHIVSSLSCVPEAFWNYMTLTNLHHSYREGCRCGVTAQQNADLTSHSLKIIDVSVKDKCFPLPIQSCIVFVVCGWPWLFWRHSKTSLTAHSKEIEKIEKHFFFSILSLITNHKSVL